MKCRRCSCVQGATLSQCAGVCQRCCSRTAVQIIRHNIRTGRAYRRTCPSTTADIISCITRCIIRACARCFVHRQCARTIWNRCTILAPICRQNGIANRGITILGIRFWIVSTPAGKCPTTACERIRRHCCERCVVLNVLFAIFAFPAVPHVIAYRI